MPVSGMFYPNFSETEKVRVVRADEDRYRSRMKTLKNRSDQGHRHGFESGGKIFDSLHVGHWAVKALLR